MFRPALIRINDAYFKALDFILFLCMTGMVVTVFGNVVLRYGFNSGILVSEELSRFLFVWMTFIGAIVVLREHGHLGMDTVLKRLPVGAARLAKAVSDVLVIICCGYLVIGTWQQRAINLDNLTPVLKVPLELVYSVAYVAGGSMIVITAMRLVAGLLPGAPDPRISTFVDAEEEAAIKAARSELGKPNA